MTRAPDTPAREIEGRAAPAGGTSSMLGDLLHVLASRSSQIGVNLLIGVATGRIWGPEAMGIIALSLSIPGMVTDLLDLGTRKSLPYMIGQSGRSVQQVMSSAATMWIIVSIAAVALSMGILFSPMMRDVPFIWGLLGALTIPASLFGTYARSFAIGVRRLSFFKHQVWIRDPLTLAVVLVGGYVLGFSSPEFGWIRLLGALLGFIAAAWLSLRLFRQYVSLRPGVDLGLMRSLVGQSALFGIGIWTMRMNYQIGLLMLGVAIFKIPGEQLGNFRAAMTVAMLLWQIPGILSIVMVSHGVNTSDQRYASYRAALIGRVATIVAIPFAVALWFAAPYIVPLVYGPGFADAGKITQIFVPGMVAFFGARAFEADLSAKGRPVMIIAVMGPLVVLNIGLSWFFIPRMGAHGAAMASSISYVVGTLGLGIMFSRSAKMSLFDVFMPRVEDFRVVWRRLEGFVLRSLGRSRRKASVPDETRLAEEDEEEDVVRPLDE